MTRFLIAFTLVVSSSATATAHDSIVPHAHPHDAHQAMHIDMSLGILLAVLVAGLGVYAFRRSRGRK